VLSSGGLPTLAFGRPTILPGSDLPLQTESAHRPRYATSVDEEVRRRGLHPEIRHFHVLKALLYNSLTEQGFGVERVQDWIGHAIVDKLLRRFDRAESQFSQH